MIDCVAGSFSVQIRNCIGPRKMCATLYGWHWCSSRFTRVTSHDSAKRRAASFIGTPVKSPWTSPGTRSSKSSWYLPAHSPEMSSWACALAAASAAASAPPRTSARKAAALLEGFAGLLAPLEAVGVAAQVLHPDPIVARVAARVAGDLHGIADAQRLVRDALARERARPTPFDGPAV